MLLPIKLDKYDILELKLLSEKINECQSKNNISCEDLLYSILPLISLVIKGIPLSNNEEKQFEDLKTTTFYILANLEDR